jgi:hypothetical protein
MTRRHPHAARLAASALALAMAAAGCSLIVSGDVPDFQCLPGSAAACPTGMTCNASARCVVDEGGIDPVEAGEEDAPDEDVTDAGHEAEAGPAPNGTKCRVDNECKSRLCGSGTILTAAITAATGPICTTTCCRSEDCGPSFVCFNGGTGGGYCVPASLAQRTPPATGGKTGGSTCSNNNECRSGLCAGPGTKRCLDTCCSDGQCGAGSVCRIKAVGAPGPNHDTWVCAAAEVGATAAAGAACTNAPAECRSDTCIGSICVPACSGHATCVAIPGFVNGHCRYGTSGADLIKYCQKTTPPGLANGATCMNDSDCQYDYCDGELKKCTNVCATDADCTSVETCRPSTGTPRLRCVLKP